MPPQTHTPQRTNSPQSKNIQLTPARPKHAAVWWQWRQEPECTQHNPLDQSSIEDLAIRLQKTSANLQEKANEYRWIIELDNNPVGTIAITSPNWRMGTADIGYMLTSAVHKQGIGTLATAQTIEAVFTLSPIRRICALISEQNIASIRLIERLGFLHEGTLRKHFVIQGRPTDERFYGLLREDWLKNNSTAS